MSGFGRERVAGTARVIDRRPLPRILLGLLLDATLTDAVLTVHFRHRGLLLAIGGHAAPSLLLKFERLDAHAGCHAAWPTTTEVRTPDLQNQPANAEGAERQRRRKCRTLRPAERRPTCAGSLALRPPPAVLNWIRPHSTPPQPRYEGATRAGASRARAAVRWASRWPRSLRTFRAGRELTDSLPRPGRQWAARRGTG